MGNTVGGAQNKSNFDASLLQGILPPLSSITYGGSFNEYYFDDGYKSLDEICYFHTSRAHSVDPLTDEEEDYVSISLHSCKDGKNERDPLNLIICLDISGSMAEKLETETKMKVSNEVVGEIIKILTDNETLGIILFDENTEVFHQISKISEINKEELISKVMNIKEQGGTNMTLAFKEALKMMETVSKNKQEEDPKNNRILFLTDAIPNIETEKELFTIVNEASNNGVYSTFIGIGLDFNSDVIDEITKAKGSNYFSVHSKTEFEKILKVDFNYIVSPIVTSSHLLVQSKSFEIVDAFGTPFPRETTKEFIQLGSQCASDLIGKETKGGLILIKLKRINEGKDIDLIMNYKTSELENNKSQTVSLKFDLNNEYYENDAIRKVIVLKRYVEFMRKIISSEESEKERIKKEMKIFMDYMKNETKIISDPQLQKEIEKIDQIKYAKYEKVNTESLGYLKRKMRRDLMITNLAKIKPKSKTVEIEKKQRELGYLLLKSMDGNVGDILDLLAQGAYPNFSDENGDFPIHLAMKRNDSFDIIRMFFDEKLIFETDINAKNKNGETVLHLACHHPDPDFIGYLLDKGVDPNIQDVNGDTCLHILATLSNEKSIHYETHLQHCLDYGASLEIKNNKGLYCNQITNNTGFNRRFMEHKFDTSSDVSGGDVEVGLFWNNLNDLDLHCVCRCKNEISYMRRDCLTCFAHLDVDMNVSVVNDPKVSSNTPSKKQRLSLDSLVEHIFWPIIIPGEYTVYVHHFKNHKGIPNETPYLVSIMVGGSVMFEFQGCITENVKDKVVVFEFDSERKFKILKE